MSSFNQLAPSVPTILNTSNCFIFSNSSSGNALSVQQLGAGNVVSFSNASGGSNVFVMNNLGRVGLGTTNPAANFHVYGASPYVVISDSSATTDTKNWWQSYSGTNAIFYCANDANSASSQWMVVNRSGYTPQYISWLTGGSERMRIDSSGRLGIGTASPGCPLDVVGGPSVSTPAGYYFSSTVGAITSFGTSAQAPSIRASAQVHGTAFFAYSDARIKNIEPSTASHLETLNALKVREYTYIDKAHDPRKKFGFIAQEVEEIMPTTINKETRIIPNIFRVAEFVSSNIVTLTNHGLTVGTNVKLVKFDNSEITSNVVMTDDNTFQVESPLSETRIFVYGTEVTDFMSIDYTQIFSSAVGAIQELSAENKALEARLAALEKAMLSTGTAGS